MYAIIKAGGKQYTVKPGDVLRVEKLEAELGSELNLDVLMIGGEKTFVGSNMGKAAVTAVVTNQQRGPKVIIFKKKRRQGYRRTGGHRQPYTEIFVSSITSPEGQTVKADNKPAVYDPEKKAAKVAKTQEVREQHRENARKARAAGETVPAAEPKRKAAGKKAAPKKAGAKAKKTGAKKTAAKKTAKKTTKK
jgi:large subunit ribosomal protein L21